MEIRVTADKTTLSVMGADGVRHIIHSDEFGIAAILDVLGKANADAKDAERYRWLESQAVSGDWGHHYGWKLHLDVKGAPSLETFGDCIDAMRSESQPQAREENNG